MYSNILFSHNYAYCFQSIAGVREAEIKQWAAGKEGNLRALLSTMQYVSYYPPRLGNCCSIFLIATFSKLIFTLLHRYFFSSLSCYLFDFIKSLLYLSDPCEAW